MAGFNLKKVGLSIATSMFLLSSTFVPMNQTTSVITAEAATTRLNRTSISVEEGGQFTLKLLGTKNKAKWTSSDSSIAKVSNKGIVTGVNAGKTRIKCTVKVGKKKKTLKTTVKVKQPEDLAESLKAPEYKGKNFEVLEHYEFKDYVALKVQCNRSENRYGSLGLKYYDSNGNLITTNSTLVNYKPNSYKWAFVETPKNSAREPIPYAYYSVEIQYAWQGGGGNKNDYDLVKDKIVVDTSSIAVNDSGYYTMKLTNNYTSMINSVSIIAFAWKNDQPIGIGRFSKYNMIKSPKVPSSRYFW